MDNNDAAEHVVNTLGNYLATGTAGPIYQGVVRLPQFRRGGQYIDRYTVEFDLLRRDAEPKMRIGAGSPVASVSVFCAQRAALSRREKSLASASSRRSLLFEDVAMAMRRVFGSWGGAVRQGVPAAEDVGEPLEV